MGKDMKTEVYSLRQRKHARTKLAIMNAFIKRLEKSRLEDISIRQICKSVEISEGTFFNYFPQKLDIINYYKYLMFLRIIWQARQDAPPDKCLALIRAAFKRMAEESKNASIIYQIIAVMIVQQEMPKKAVISDIEKQIAFPGCPGIENISSVCIDDFIKECLKGAVHNGELPSDTRVDDVLVSLMAIIGGTLLAAKFADVKDRSYHYMRQLELLWKGLGAKVR